MEDKIFYLQKRRDVMLTTQPTVNQTADEIIQRYEKEMYDLLEHGAYEQSERWTRLNEGIEVDYEHLSRGLDRAKRGLRDIVLTK